MPETLFDVIVIGAGPTGENVADRAVKGGLTAAIVESNLAGGECSYSACIPSKVLLRSGVALQAARRVNGAKQAITGSLDASAVLARRTLFTESWKDDSQVGWLKGAKVTLVRGHARLSGERIVEVRAPDGSICAPDVKGEIMLFRKGEWLATKDLGWTDADGYFYHGGRADDVIISAGWTIGAGLEFALAQNWTAKAEYLYVDLGKFNCGVSCGFIATNNVSFTTNLVRAGVNYHF